MSPCLCLRPCRKCVAYHEAGHAVAAAAVGYPLREHDCATIKPSDTAVGMFYTDHPYHVLSVSFRLCSTRGSAGRICGV
jgi:hypothetical protein